MAALVSRCPQHAGNQRRQDLGRSAARARRAVPRGSVRSSPKEDPPVDRAGRKKPSSVARRLPFCGGADPDPSAAQTRHEMAHLKQIPNAATTTPTPAALPTPPPHPTKHPPPLLPP